MNWKSLFRKRTPVAAPNATPISTDVSNQAKPAPRKTKWWHVFSSSKKTAKIKELKSAVPNTKGFHDLAPSGKVDQSNIYFEALEWALKNENIKNIAISGSYGSGKSSIIKAFRDTHAQYQYLQISLATFSDGNPKTDQEQTKQTKTDSKERQDEKNNSQTPDVSPNWADQQRLIELSILQQIFYHVRGTEIPDSRFKRIFSLSEKEMRKRVGLACIGVIALVAVIFPGNLSRYNWWYDLYLWQQDLLTFIPFAVLLFVISHLSTYFFRLLNQSGFNKLNVIKGELELNPRAETSILNKHLDEILYFFEATPFNVVIFEDLDRFEHPEIYTKLRELNKLLNDSRQVGKHIVFIYAIKDDMFKTQDRAKFFDFIIPVIPVISVSNSVDKLQEILNASETKMDFSIQFLRATASYIDDMRTLKNIYNEFIIYKHAINIERNDKLMGMIIYKNCYPSDFAELQCQKGILYRVLRSRNYLEKKLTENIYAKIDELKDPILKAENVIPKNILQLRSMYLPAILEEIATPTITGFFLAGERVNVYDAVKDKWFDTLITPAQMQVYFSTQNGYESTKYVNMNFAVVEKKVDSDERYAEKVKKIESKEVLDKARKEIKELEDSLQEIQMMKVGELLRHDVNAISHCEKEFTDKPLLVYLVRNSYIDESYSTLISFFYPGSITPSDNQFVVSVQDFDSKEFRYELTYTSNILDRFTLSDFKSDAILNNDLVDYIYKNRAKYLKECTLLLDRLMKKYEVYTVFLQQYLQYGKEVTSFLEFAQKPWPSIWKDLQSTVSDDPLATASLLKAFLIKLNFQHFKRLNIDDSFKKVMAQNWELISSLPIEFHQKILGILKSLAVYFKNLDHEGNSPELFESVYQEGHYDLNLMNVTTIVHRKTAQSYDNTLFTTQNYTYIRSLKLEHLHDQIADFTDEYVEETMLELNENKNESEETLILLLNSDNLIIENKRKVLEQTLTKILHPENISEQIDKELVFDTNAAFADWDNVIGYFQSAGEFDDALIKFLNTEENYRVLSSTSIEDSELAHDPIEETFCGALIDVAALTDEAYTALVQKVDRRYDDVPFGELSKAKIQALLNFDLLALSVSNFNYLKENIPNDHIRLIQNQPILFATKQKEFLFTSADLTLFLRSPIDSSSKTKILAGFDPSVLEADKDAVDESIQLLSLKTSVAVPLMILEAVIGEGLDSEEKLWALIRQIPFRTKLEVASLLLKFSSPIGKIPLAKSSVTIPDAEITRALAEALKEKEMVRAFEEGKGGLLLKIKR